MAILSTKRRIRLIVLVLVALLITAGFYFGMRWTARENQLEADLAQKKTQLEKWSDDFLNEFPDVPAAKAMVEVYQEILTEVIARNEELRQEGMSTRRRIKHLTQFAKEISGPIAERTRSTELQLKLMRENSALKEKIDRYTHRNVILPLPLYLLGANEKELETLQKILEESQHGP